MEQLTCPRYPDIRVTLLDSDGNAYSIISKVLKALRRAKVPKSIRDEFYTDATSGDYDHLLSTCFRWVEVD